MLGSSRARLRFRPVVISANILPPLLCSILIRIMLCGGVRMQCPCVVSNRKMLPALVYLIGQWAARSGTHANLEQYFELCRAAYSNGDYNYVRAALQANRDGMPD